MESQLKRKRSKAASISVHSQHTSLRPVDCMTSRDFQNDVSAHIEVAAQRLKDQANISTFAEVILHNRHLFRDRTVLDVGCGLGILSLFAAKAGAARVYAVDCSNVVDYTRRIVVDNGYEDVIQVIKGDIENVELPKGADVVDIIICDWMGYSLFFQSACDAVIYARDKWLRKDGKGLIFPDMAKLFMAALEDNLHKNERVEWWRDVYGFDMKCLRDCALMEPSFQEVLPQQIVSTQYGIKHINLYTATVRDLQFRSKYIIETVRAGHMDGIVTYFNVYFSKSHTPKRFGTGPTSCTTRWMQSVFFFDTPININGKQRFYGGIEMYSKAENSKCDLGNMEVGFEMFSGDSSLLNLEVEMCWKLKPRATTQNCATASSISVITSTTTTVPSPNAINDAQNVLEQNKKPEPKIGRKLRAKVPDATIIIQESPKKSLPITRFLIGKEQYPCLAMRNIRKKGKHTAKG